MLQTFLYCLQAEFPQKHHQQPGAALMYTCSLVVAFPGNCAVPMPWQKIGLSSSLNTVFDCVLFLPGYNVLNLDE